MPRSTEFDPNSKDPVIDIMIEQKGVTQKEELCVWGTMNVELHRKYTSSGSL